jgi:hypothetical protein
MLRKAALAAIGAAGLVIPAAAAAQPYYAPTHGQFYRAQYYGERGGDYDDRWRAQYGRYPEFRGIEEHIRREIQEGVRDDLIERDDARDLFAQLRDIQAQEAREFRVHGWNLPEDDRYQLRSRLERLDALVDEIRAEPED